MSDDPNIRVHILSAAMNVGEHALELQIRLGKLPPTGIVRYERGRYRAWKLSTIRDWNPTVADRCAAILEALDKAPPMAA